MFGQQMLSPNGKPGEYPPLWIHSTKDTKTMKKGKESIPPVLSHHRKAQNEPGFDQVASGESKGENAQFTTVSQQTTITIVILCGVC